MSWGCDGPGRLTYGHHGLQHRHWHRPRRPRTPQPGGMLRPHRDGSHRPDRLHRRGSARHSTGELRARRRRCGDPDPCGVQARRRRSVGRRGVRGGRLRRCDDDRLVGRPDRPCRSGHRPGRSWAGASRSVDALGTRRPPGVHSNRAGDGARATYRVVVAGDVAEWGRGGRVPDSLLEAVVSIGRDLDLETVLRRIVKAATSLVECEYGALGVIGDDGRLAQFIPVGVTEEEIAGVHHWPEGHGILGQLIKEPQVLRLDDIAAASESYGFPPGHPHMRTFLGVPLTVGDRVFGNLYLADKTDGRLFTEQDERVVQALAAAAGVAVENARRYEETRDRESWLDASGQITRELLSGGQTDDALRTLATSARHMSDAAVTAVVVPATGDDHLLVTAVDGDDTLLGAVVPIQGTVIGRSEEHTSELQSRGHLVCRLLLEKKKRARYFNG